MTDETEVESETEKAVSNETEERPQRMTRELVYPRRMEQANPEAHTPHACTHHMVQLGRATLQVIATSSDARVRNATQIMNAKENLMQSRPALKSDLDCLLDLNRDYIRSVQASDVSRFQQILAEDFHCSLPDGSLLDREGFLKYSAAPLKISNLEAYDVKVRLMGDFAIIHARTSYAMQDGRQGHGRYTDVWARRNGQWLAVSAHVTRC
jgi:ketosteroid isomerase-like protein